MSNMHRHGRSSGQGRKLAELLQGIHHSLEGCAIAFPPSLRAGWLQRLAVASKKGYADAILIGPLLSDVARAGNVEIVRSILAAGVDPDVESLDGCTPLFGAVLGGNLDAISALLEKGADKDRAVVAIPHFPGKGPPVGRTPLMAAVDNGTVGAVRLLLDAGQTLRRQTWMA